MGFKLVLIILTFLEWIAFPIFWYKSLKQKKRVPKTDNPLVHLSATQLSRKIRKKEVGTCLMPLPCRFFLLKNCNMKTVSYIIKDFHLNTM